MQCKFFLCSDGHNLLKTTTGKLSDLERGFIFSRIGQIERYFDIYVAINMYDETGIKKIAFKSFLGSLRKVSLLQLSLL